MPDHYSERVANIPDSPYTLPDTQIHLFLYIVHAFADAGYWGYWNGWESLRGCANAGNSMHIVMLIFSLPNLAVVICKSREHPSTHAMHDRLILDGKISLKIGHSRSFLLVFWEGGLYSPNYIFIRQSFWWIRIHTQENRICISRMRNGVFYLISCMI